MNSIEVGRLLQAKGVPSEGLCAYLARRLLEPGAEPCKHDFKHTRDYVTSYRGIADPEPVLALLEEAGAVCDCEVGYNFCAEIGE